MPREPPFRPTRSSPYHLIPSTNQSSFSENALHNLPHLHLHSSTVQPSSNFAVQSSPGCRRPTECVSPSPLNPISRNTTQQPYFVRAAIPCRNQTSDPRSLSNAQAEVDVDLVSHFSPLPAISSSSRFSDRVEDDEVSHPIHHISAPPEPTALRDHPCMCPLARHEEQTSLQPNRAIYPYTMQPPSHCRLLPYAYTSSTDRFYHPFDAPHYLSHIPIVRRSHSDLAQAQNSTASPSLGTSELLPHLLPYQNRSMFNGAHSFVIKDSVMTSIEVRNQDNFMEKLLKMAIPGAEFDSSDRDPPPRCHPGTRQAVINRCHSFVVSCEGRKKLFWLVGFAGVGKSAIMQSIAEGNLEDVTVGASVFFSVNGRFDGSKTVTTIAYQLAVRCQPYRQFIQNEATIDPSIFQKSLPAQFNKLIIEPFIHRRVLAPSSRLLIIIDGIDECSDRRTQWELLDLISEFCITFPTSPLVWFISSRPEAHVTSFFSLSRVMTAYVKEEVPVDTDEAREDVELFLREEMKRIQQSTDLLSDFPQWPGEGDFTKITNAAGGLFSYASTVVKYIGDSACGNPDSQLRDVLKSMDATLDLSQTRNPMAQLDTLYDRIMSNIPVDVKENTRKLLLLLVSGNCQTSFILQCNLLGMTKNDAYSAVHLLRSVLRVPLPNESHREPLESFHKSFLDYLSNFARSKFSPNIEQEFQALQVQYVFRIIEEVPDGIDHEEEEYSDMLDVARGSGTRQDISLAWPAREGCDINDDRISFMIYIEALEVICKKFKTVDAFRSMLGLRALTRHLIDFANPTHHEVFDVLFDESRREEYMRHGILQQVPLKTLISNSSIDCLKVKLRRPITTTAKLSDPWDKQCAKHVEKWTKSEDQYWQVLFSGIYGGCSFCDKLLDCHLKSRLSDFPDLLVTSSSPTHDPYPTSWVEFRFVNPNDGVSEWTYHCVFYRVNPGL